MSWLIIILTWPLIRHYRMSYPQFLTFASDDPSEFWSNEVLLIIPDLQFLMTSSEFWSNEVILIIPDL